MWYISVCAGVLLPHGDSLSAGQSSATCFIISVVDTVITVKIVDKCELSRAQKTAITEGRCVMIRTLAAKTVFIVQKLMECIMS